MVTTTMVAGRVLMRDRQLLTWTKPRSRARARELAAKVWKAYHLRAADGLTPEDVEQGNE